MKTIDDLIKWYEEECMDGMTPPKEVLNEMFNLKSNIGNDIKIEGFLYPENIKTPKDMIDYVLAVYGISDDSKGLIEATIKEICIKALKFNYDGWFEDSYNNFLNSNSL
jgi:hypothetical protein